MNYESAMGKDTLSEFAKVIRSKNAGPFELTFDIMFDDVANTNTSKDPGVITAARIAEAYRIRVDDVLVAAPRCGGRLQDNDQTPGWLG